MELEWSHMECFFLSSFFCLSRFWCCCRLDNRYRVWNDLIRLLCAELFDVYWLLQEEMNSGYYHHHHRQHTANYNEPIVNLFRFVLFLFHFFEFKLEMMTFVRQNVENLSLHDIHVWSCTHAVCVGKRFCWSLLVWYVFLYWDGHFKRK